MNSNYYALTIALLSLSFTKLISQSTFRTNIDVASIDFPITTTEALTPGNYVFSGFHTNFFPISSSLSEIDNASNIVWSKRYSGASFAYMFGDVKKDVAANQYYACGGDDGGPAFLLFLDATGGLISGRTFSISQATGAFFNRVQKTTDGGYICVGYVNGHNPGGGETNFVPLTNTQTGCNSSATEVINSPLIVKFDAAGNHVWHHVFRYYMSSVAPANRIYNDASFVDVVEVSDGYIAVGSYDVNNVFSNYDSDNCEDRTATDAIILKTSTTGTITFHKQIDALNTTATQSSKSFASITKTAAGLPLLSGSDGSGRPALFMRLQGTGGWANPTWVRKYGSPIILFGFPTGAYHPLIPSRFFETADGKYASWANYFETSLPIVFSNALIKIEPSNNNVIWAKQHTFNLASFLPHGEQVSDGGYIGFSYTMASGHDLHFIKTDVNGNAPSSCAPGNLSLTSEGPSYTYVDPLYLSWNSGTVTNGTATPTVTSITPGNSIVCIQTVCTPPAAPTTVTVTPSTICAGQSSVINVSLPVSGVTYNVYTAITGGTNLGAIPQTVSPSSNTTYYVEAVNSSDPTCVSTTRTPITITVNPAPTATAGGGGTICTGGTINLTAATVIGASYGWTGPNSFTSPSQNPSITNATLAMTGTYTLTVTLNGCTATSTVDVTVGNPPQAVASSNSPVCIGQQIELFGQTTSGTHTWTGPNSFNGSIQNPVIGNATAANGGTYTYTFTENGCTSLPATVTVVVNPAPSPTATSNSPICAGNTIELTATGGVSYSWSGPNSFSGTSAFETIPTATTAFSGPFVVTATDMNGCSATATVLVNVTNGPTVNVSGTNVLCNGGTNGQAIANPIGTGPFTYNWSPSGQTNQTALNLGAGVHTVTVTDGNNCSTLASTTLTEPAAMVLTTSTTPSSCTAPTGSASVAVSGGAGSFTYSWSPSGGTGNTTTPVSADSYVVTVTDANSCQATATVNVPSVNGPSVTLSGVTDATCFGSANGSATAIASLGTPGYTYVWAPTGGTSSTASGLIAGTYTVTVTDAAGCSTAETVVINQPSQILLNETVTSATCGNTDGEISLAVTGGSGVYSYAWTPATIFGANPSGIYGGSYSVEVTDDQGCSSTQAIIVGVLGSLNVDVTPNLAEIVQGETVDIITTVVPENAGNTYSWTPTSDLSCTVCPNPTASPNETTLYTVTVTAPDGCVGSDTALIVVEMLCGDFFLPTIFSPNNDGLNDELCLLGNCIDIFHLRIYDRWGELVFETKDQDVCWDGFYNGKIMNTASFVYVLDLRTLSGEEFNLKGNLSLVR
jgi:gliding motility-associated-like protein